MSHFLPTACAVADTVSPLRGLAKGCTPLSQTKPNYDADFFRSCVEAIGCGMGSRVNDAGRGRSLGLDSAFEDLLREIAFG